MGTHPIEELMKTAMESIRDMVDVNTIVGDAVQTVDDDYCTCFTGSFWFCCRGGDFQSQKDLKSSSEESDFPLQEVAVLELQYTR